MREPVVDLEGLRGARIEGAFEYEDVGVVLLLDRNRFCYFQAVGSYDPDVQISDLSGAPEGYLADLDRAMVESEAEEEKDGALSP